MSPWRFFRFVRLQHGILQLAFGTVVAYAVYVLWLSPAEATAPLALILLLQMFSAGTGFRRDALAGYYDGILCAGRTRTAVGLAHWAWSAMPGVVAWSCVAVLEILLSRGQHAAALRLGPLLALCVVSTWAWTINLALPRFSGGVLWLGAILGMAATDRGGVLLRQGLSAPPETWMESLRQGLTGVAVPFLLAASEAPAGGALAIAAGSCGLGLLAGLVYVRLMECPLSSQS